MSLYKSVSLHIHTEIFQTCVSIHLFQYIHEKSLMTLNGKDMQMDGHFCEKVDIRAFDVSEKSGVEFLEYSIYIKKR